MFERDWLVDGGAVFLDGRGELLDEVAAADAWKMRPHAGADRRRQDAHTYEIGKTRSITSSVQVDLVARVLTMDVVEGVVGVSLIVKGPDAGPFEASGKSEAPAERGLDMVCECPRGSSIRRQLGMEVIVGGAERQQASSLTLREHDASNGSKVCRGGGNGPVVFETYRHVVADRFA